MDYLLFSYMSFFITLSLGKSLPLVFLELPCSYQSGTPRYTISEYSHFTPQTVGSEFSGTYIGLVTVVSAQPLIR
jgi:hypothetical protein